MENIKICRNCGYLFHKEFGKNETDNWYCQRHKHMADNIKHKEGKKSPNIKNTLEIT